jgi:hypothetical protein
MQTTIQRSVQTAACSSLLLLSALGAAGQGTFQNLDFEDTTLSVFVTNPSGPSYTTNATLPGWTWSPQFTGGYGDPTTTVAFNNMALDSSAITLQGTDSRVVPALAGQYSALLQGGTQYFWVTNGASIWQTGQIPANARSLTYLGWASLRVTFNGQSLSPIALASGPNYTEWGVDISPYAGQSGELRFAVPWLMSSILDGIEFSSLRIPKPSALSLSLFGLLLVAGHAGRSKFR